MNQENNYAYISRLALLLRKIGNASSFSGRFRLLQSVLRRFFRHARVVVRVSDFDGDLSVDLRLSEHMQRRIFWMGYYNGTIIDFINRTLSSGMIIIDVGANIGEISMVAAKRVGAEGKVVAFEPVDAIADELEANVRNNRLDQISIVRMGLSDTACTNAPIYASCDNSPQKEENRGLGTLFGASSSQAPLQRVTITTLDAWIAANPLERVDLIKIDIEGAELPCLHGAEKTLRRFEPALIIEVQDASTVAAGYQARDILDFLSGLGYVFHSIGSKGQLSSLDVNDLVAFQNVLCTAAGTRLPVRP